MTLMIAVLLPLLLAAAIWIPGLRRLGLLCAPWAPLPALVIALGLEGPADSGWDWVLLGMRLGATDAVTRVFLLFTSALWLLAGLFARSFLAEDSHRARFVSLFLVTLTGNLGLILAAELASFYFFYALMTFAAYGLVVHEPTDAARRAGRVYLVMALVGELLLLTAFLLLVGAEVNVALREVPGRIATSTRPELLAGLLLAGFGIKAGAILLHLWLPLAHPVAPTPASAVLSGAIIKAGLLGWLRLLPLGTATLPVAGMVCVLAGFAAAFYGVVIGVTQKDPKTILAYSSISQMGLMTAALGIGLADPAAAPAAVAAILFYAMHHALVKGALFLGTGVVKTAGSGWPRRLVALGLLWLSLALAGAPLSSGALAKLSLHAVVKQAPGGVTWLPALLSLAAIGTTVLMSAFLLRAVPKGASAVPRAGLWVPWVALILLNLGLLVSPPVATEAPRLLLLPGKLWSAAWPVCVGVGIAAAAIRLRPRLAILRTEVPPGDILAWIEASSRAVRRSSAPAFKAASRTRLRDLRARPGQLQRLPGWLLDVAGRTEVALASFGNIGLLFVVLGLVAVALLLLSS